MRILQIGWGKTPFQVGGAIIYTEDLCNEFSKRGHEVAYFCAGSYDYHIVPYIKEEIARVSMDTAYKIYELRNSPNLYNNWDKPLEDCRNIVVELSVEDVLLKFKPQIVHVQNLPGMCGSIIKLIKNKGIPTVVSLPNYWYLCPRVELIDYRGEVCDNFLNGIKCLPCVPKISSRRARIMERFTFMSMQALHQVSSINRKTREFFRSLYYLFSNLLIPIRKVNEIHEKTCFPNSSQDYSGNPFYVRRKMLIENLNDADVVIAKSKFQRELYVKHGVDESKIRALPSGIQVAGPVTSKIRKDYSHPIKFGYIGVLAPWKGVHILIKAFSKIDQKRARLLIFGGGDKNYEDYLKILAKGFNVEFKGGYDHEKLKHILSSIDVGVVPSIWYEVFGQTVVQLLAAKIPVIGSDIGGIPDLVLHNGNGLLFKAGDIEDLARKMETVVENPMILRKLRKGIRNVKTMQEHAFELERIYISLIKAGSR